VGFNPGFDLNCALLVDRLSGLRGEAELAPEADAVSAKPAFVGARWRDGAGRLWQELLLSELAGDETFLRVVD
jgi:twitching motility protein PilI